ncbi:MAG: hypothetical protein JRJ06_07045, partial [Deltaproteobacteria bacterium]|nr:hypothetical protein [Deltaproteobacteria bacterium]
VLSRNYRSTQVILDGASDLMGKEKPLDGVRTGGDIIRFAQCHTHSEEAEMVVEQIERLMGGTTHFSLDSGGLWAGPHISPLIAGGCLHMRTGRRSVLGI